MPGIHPHVDRPGGRVVRLLRYLTWRRNGMSRHTDRLESGTVAALILAVLATIPIAVFTSRSMVSHGLAQAEHVRRTAHVATATLTEDAAQSSSTLAGVPVAEAQNVPATWRGADGRRHHGTVSASTGDRAGTRVQIWLDARDRPILPPETSAAVTADAVAAGILIVAGTAFAAEGVRRFVKWRLDRTRITCWEYEWDLVGPRWSRRIR